MILTHLCPISCVSLHFNVQECREAVVNKVHIPLKPVDSTFQRSLVYPSGSSVGFSCVKKLEVLCFLILTCTAPEQPLHICGCHVQVSTDSNQQMCIRNTIFKISTVGCACWPSPTCVEIKANSFTCRLPPKKKLRVKLTHVVSL